MACAAALEAGHREVAAHAPDIDAVVDVTYLDTEESSSDYPETEIVARTSSRGCVPNAILYVVGDAGMRIASIQRDNNPEYHRIVVR
jgi:hypothetical protein